MKLNFCVEMMFSSKGFANYQSPCTFKHPSFWSYRYSSEAFCSLDGLLGGPNNSNIVLNKTQNTTLIKDNHPLDIILSLIQPMTSDEGMQSTRAIIQD